MFRHIGYKRVIVYCQAAALLHSHFPQTMPMTVRLFNYDSVFAQLSQEGFGQWVNDLQCQCEIALAPATHGNLDTWQNACQQLPKVDNARLDTSNGFHLTGSISETQKDVLKQSLMLLHPWRKGPFHIFGVHIDTEWRSDWKWKRLQDHIELRNRSVLDVGCGNGYYGWRMLAGGATRVIGLDPFLLYVMQHEAIKTYAGPDAPNYVLPLGDSCLPKDLQAFDVTFSMGVLYHRSSPIDHLQTLQGTLKKGGQLVLETLVVEGDPNRVLVPESRYAKMRNVWFIPSIEQLQLWLRRVGFREISMVDVTTTSVQEQRSTNWMRFESLPNFLNPTNHAETIEGYPAPCRAVVIATK